jgi:hypothetical protein
MDTLNSIDFSIEEKKLICSIINRCGDYNHPYADINTFDFFTISYLKEILKKKRFEKLKNNLTDIGKKILADIELKL